ncbi:MAG: GtrA family protein [Clostridia bacterium]|nr:GtrA family protein [Clostridia bacterium]
MNKRLIEVLKFALTGGVCFLIEYAALVVLKEWLRVDVLIATPIAFLISVIVNYLMCVRWVFPGAKDGSRRAQVGFVITSGLGLVINWALMALLTALFGQDVVLLTMMGLSVKVYMVNKVIATLVVMVWNYFTKRFVLKG